MAGGTTLTPQEVAERLNRSLEQELFNIAGALPASPTRTRPVPHQTLDARFEVSTAAPQTKANANASLLDKLEASRLRALETLSSVLFDDGRDRRRGGAHPTKVGVSGAIGDRLGSPSRGGCVVGCKAKERRPVTSTARRPPLKERLRRRAAVLVQQERESLLHELHAELELERKRFEARKPGLSEEAYRAARAEHASALEKQERELRMVLARREFKDLKDVARERLAIAHAQEKETILARLRRSLGRGTGHSVSGLRGQLWEEAHEKRNRALHEGEAAFEHSCRLLRQQSHDRTEAKLEVMAEEAASAEQSALAALREVEEIATSDELSRVTAELEWERREAEVELKRQLHREAARSVSLAVEACTTEHKQAQQEVTATAAEALRRALEAVGEEEVARTKAVLGREARMLDDRRLSLVSIVEDGLSACSLRKLAVTGTPRPPLSPASSSSSSSPSPVRRLRPPFLFTCSHPSPTRIITPDRNRNDGGRKAEVVGRRGPTAGGLTERRDNNVTGIGEKKGFDADAGGHDDGRPPKDFRAECAAAAARAVKAVRHVEGAAAAAEREYARRAREIVRLRAAVALRERSINSHSTSNDGDNAVGAGASPALERREKGAGEGVGVGRTLAEDGGGPGMTGGDDGGRAEREDGLVGCGGCAILFEANERLLEEARARGFIDE